MGICKICGKVFIKTRSRRLYCSDECKELSQYSKDRKKEFDARNWYDYATQLKDL